MNYWILALGTGFNTNSFKLDASVQYRWAKYRTGQYMEPEGMLQVPRTPDAYRIRKGRGVADQCLGHIPRHLLEGPRQAPPPGFCWPIGRRMRTSSHAALRSAALHPRPRLPRGSLAGNVLGHLPGRRESQLRRTLRASSRSPGTGHPRPTRVGQTGAALWHELRGRLLSLHGTGAGVP